MAKTVDEQTKFIELRAKGNSFEKIAKEIKVSKPTLLKWDKEFRAQVIKLRFLHFESLAEQYSLMKKQRLEDLGELYQKLKRELGKRDLSKVATEKLLDMVTKLEDRLLSEFETIRYSTSETVDVDINFDEILKTTIVTEYKVD